MKWEVKNGTFAYPHSDRTVLKNVDFSLESGDVLAILGPNGAGKTTLLRCMMGLLPWQTGETKLDGASLSALPPKTFWRKVSYVPQARQALTAYTVEEMVLLGRASRIGVFSQPGAADREAVERSLKRTHIESLRHRPCDQLSGGELQMVLIARALASDPEVLILDEPESNLDFKNQLLVLEMISGLAREGMICIFNTHYPAHALRRADKALMLGKDGSYCFGNTRQVVTEENILRYFGVRSVIGEVETADASYSDVVPVALGGAGEKRGGSGRVIACITVLSRNADPAAELNRILHEYEDELIGRMGLPYRRAGVHIITLMLDAPAGRVLELSDRLSRIPDLRIKTSYIEDNKYE